MRRHEYESKYNPAVTELSRALNAHDGRIHPDMLAKITNVLEGVKRTDEMISQKEQLLVQKEKELVRLKSITDNSSKVARDIISESKGNLDKAVSLHKSGNFSEALKYSDMALYSMGDINSFEVKGVEQANKLYLERKQQHVEAAAKRDNLYNSSVVSSGNKSVNAFGWVKDNPTRDFYTFFREALNIPDKEQKSPDNVRIIKKLYELLPLYVEEAQRTNYFYNEYNKYYDVKTKLEQVVNIHNIRAASSKGLKDYEEALKSCEIALEIDPKNLTLSNLKNAILQEKQVVEARRLEEEKLLVSQTEEIEKLKELLALKEVETQEKNKLLSQKGNELASTEKVLIEKHQKETEALKALLAQKELENKELLARKELEKQELIAQKEKENKELLALKEKQAEELENTKRLQEENIKKEQLLSNKDKLLSDKEQRIEELKALIEQSKIEKEELLANKSHMKNQIIDGLKQEVNLKENDNFDLRLQNLEKELMTQEKEKLLAEQDIKLQNLLDLNAKLDAKMQYSAKEIKIREAEKEILSKIVNQKNDQLKYLLIEKENAVDNKSFEKNQVIKQLREEIIDLNKQLLEHDQHITHSVFLDEVGCQPGSSLFEKQLLESLNLSSINLSPINHGGQNQIVGNILGNFDIENQHITHSVLISGEDSFSIIKDDVSH